MPEIAIRCHASHAKGMGHVYRQIHLAKILRDRGMGITFFISDHPPSIQLLRKKKLCLEILNDEEGLPPGKKGDFDLVILDLRDTQKDFIFKIRRRTGKVASFEDLGPGRDHVDLLIDCNLNPTESRKVNPGVRTLFGLPHCVLAAEFEEYHRRSRSFMPGLESALVTMGGTDPNNLTLRLAETFMSSGRELSVTFVLGPGFKEKEKADQLASENPLFKVLTDVNDMADLLFSHQAVLCSGGVTLHEALAVGTPPFVISQVPHQQEKTRPIAKSGAAVNLGLAQDFDPRKILQTLEIPQNQLMDMSRKGKELVDGHGIYRVADAMQSLIAC